MSSMDGATAVSASRPQGLSRRLLIRHPALARVLRIAREAYDNAPPGSKLAVLVKPPACLHVMHGDRVVTVERFSGRDVAESFQESIRGCLDRRT